MLRNKYTVSEFLSNVWALLITKVFYRPARLIRRPIYFRGKKYAVIGKKLTIGHACRFDILCNKKLKSLIIGDNCEFGDNVHIVAHENVVIGNNVLLASKVFVSDVSHGSYRGESQSNPLTPPNSRELVTQPVSIGDNVWIGENVVILSGCKIGNGCVIGANSMVNSDIPDNSIAVGSPAKVVKCYNFNKNNWEKVKNFNIEG